MIVSAWLSPDKRLRYQQLHKHIFNHCSDKFYYLKVQLLYV